MIKIALNGYGRIGRMVHRITLLRKNLQIVAINARSEDAKMRAHLLKYDSIHGPILNDIKPTEKGLEIDGKSVRCLAVKDSGEIPWKDYNVDIVVECTGKAKNRELAAKHLIGGAKRVIVSAPMKDDTPTFVIGVNDKKLKASDTVLSNASCTTNCVAAPLKLIQEKWGIEFASVSSIHAVTHSQNLLDNSGRDLRRGRSALMSIIPTSTGATDVVAKIIPELEGKLNGMAYRVPILNSSIAEIMIHLSKPTTEKEVKEFFKGIAKDPYYDSVIDVTEDPLVSIDFKGNPHSAIIDLGLTQLDQGRYLKLFAWYDNEWGYANRLVDMIEKVGAMI